MHFRSKFDISIGRVWVMEEFIKGIPMAELHIHVKGALEPELAFQIPREIMLG